MVNLGNRIVNNWMYPIGGGCVLLDTGYEHGFAAFQTRLSRFKIELRDIKYVFLTHAHDDHAGFLNQLFAASPTVMAVMSDKALEVLRRGQNSFEGGATGRLAFSFCQSMKLFGKGAHRFPPLERGFEERCLLLSDANRKEIGRALGGTILETPGHTADSISLLLDDGTLFCGDAAMNGFPSAHRITIWAGDRVAFAHSWETMIAARPKAVYPGHGKPFPYTDLERNLSYVRDMTLYPLKNGG